MSWFTNLSPEIQAYLWGATADGTGGLAAEFATRLIIAGGARLRKKFQNAPEQTAVRRAMTEAISFALQQWEIDDGEVEHFQKLFSEWLLSPVTTGQFNLLLMPRQDQILDVDLLQEEFEATGLSADHLGLPFDELIQDMAAAFYLAARDEADLQPVIVGKDGGAGRRLGTHGSVDDRSS